jgi:hypothetical protein
VWRRLCCPGLLLERGFGRLGEKGRPDKKQREERKGRQRSRHTRANTRRKGKKEGDTHRRRAGRTEREGKKRAQKGTTSHSKTRADKRKHTRNRTPDKTERIGNREHEHTQNQRRQTERRKLLKQDTIGKEKTGKHATQNPRSHLDYVLVFVSRSSSALPSCLIECGIFLSVLLCFFPTTSSLVQKINRHLKTIGRLMSTTGHWSVVDFNLPIESRIGSRNTNHIAPERWRRWPFYWLCCCCYS